jgi:hypothetical protein
MNEKRDPFDIDNATPEETDARDRKAAKQRERRQRAESLAAQQADDENRETGTKAPPLPILDFIAFSPDHSYIYRPDGEVWSATAVNARVKPIQREGRRPLVAATWLDRNDAVEQRTWVPGESQIIEDRLGSEGGFFAKKGARVFNLYRPPQIIRVTDDDVGFWQGHLQELWPDEADHIEQWFAHRVQHPGEKINHGLLLTGEQGVGKDAVIEPLKRAIGAWNFAEISPQALLGSFNEFVRSVVLRISEIKDLGDIDRFAFYEATKTLMASPPDTLRCNPKYVKPYHVMNVTGVIMTSNYKVSGLYLPADDRRHFVAWSNSERKNFSEAYWARYWARLENGGAAAVAEHLRNLDLSGFNPKAPPRQTQAFWEIVDSLRSAEESIMGDMVESLGAPAILTTWFVAEEAKRQNLNRFAEFLEDPKSRRKVSMELEANGYQRLNNRYDKRGRWSFPSGWNIGGWLLPSGWRGSVYRRKDLTDHDGFEAIKRAGGVS